MTLKSNNLKGTSLIIISSLFYATYGIWSRLMGNDFGEFSQAWTRGVILLPIALITLYLTKTYRPIQPKDRKWFFIISLVGLNQAPYYYAFQHLSVGSATLLFYLALIIGGYILGTTIFKEHLTRSKWISLLLAGIGTFIIYRFSLQPNQLLPATMAITAGFLGAISAVLPKKLSHDYPELQIMSGYFIVMIISNGLLSIFFHDPLPSLTNSVAWIPQLAYAGSLLLANLAVIAGFKYVKATTGTILGTLEIIFAAVFGIIIFHETLSPSLLAGSTLILTAILLPIVNTTSQ